MGSVVADRCPFRPRRERPARLQLVNPGQRSEGRLAVTHSASVHRRPDPSTLLRPRNALCVLLGKVRRGEPTVERMQAEAVAELVRP